jgi:hypothetical protein
LAKILKNNEQKQILNKMPIFCANSRSGLKSMEKLLYQKVMLRVIHRNSGQLLA